MLKKSLIAVALLAIVLPAFAADPTVLDQKFHKPWPGKKVITYNWQDVQSINVVMDVGYWIEIQYTGDIKISQDASLGDPFFSYSGCLEGVQIKSNFNAQVKGKCATTTAAVNLGVTEAVWAVYFDGASTLQVNAGTVVTKICVTGLKVAINKIPQQDNFPIAVVTIQVIPWEYRNAIETTF